MTKKEVKKLTDEQSAMAIFQKLAICREVCDGKPMFVNLVFDAKGQWIVNNIGMLGPDAAEIAQSLMPFQKKKNALVGDI